MVTTMLIAVILILTAIREGLINRWGLEPNKARVRKISRVWHALGFLIRALLVVIIFLISGNWYITGAAAFFCWLPYNMIINWCNGWPTFYFGKTSWIDKLINKLL